MLQQVASAARDGTPSAAGSAVSSSLLLSESQQSIGGPPPLMEKLTPREREIVLKQGRRKVLNRGQTLFNQGAKHDGIYLIESGRIRVFYTSPLGREITLAYWRAGNFVGGPEVFAMFLDRYDTFWLSQAPRVQIPDGEGCFPGVPAQSPQAILAAHGLTAGDAQILDAAHQVTVTPWRRQQA